MANACALRDAVAVVNAGSLSGASGTGCSVVGALGNSDTIDFHASSMTGDIILSQGEIEIQKNLTINDIVDGNGLPQVTLDANGASRILYASGALNNLSVSGLVFKDGKVTGPGDAVFMESGSLAVSNSTFENNTADDQVQIGGVAVAGGGAIRANADVTVDRSRFLNNATTFPGGGNSGGTVIAVTAVVRDSLFDNNTADGNGGALRTAKDATVTGSTFRNNKAAMVGGRSRVPP